MARKYINRSKKRSEKDSAEDEWAHITGIEEGPNLEIKDALDVQERSITLRKEQAPKTTLEAVKEEARNAMDAAGNTGQYIRFVNAHIDKQKKEIDKIKKIKDKFDEEVELLQSHDPNLLKLDSDSIEDFDIKTVREYLQKLLTEKGLTKNKLGELKSGIDDVETEIRIQEDQIEDLNKELVSKKKNEQKNQDETLNIKNELNELVEKYGIDNLSKVLKSAKSSQKQIIDKKLS